MFNWMKNREVSDLENEIQELTEERSKLRDELQELREELTRVKSEKRLEERQTKHLVKMREEQLQIELERKVMEAEKGKQWAIAKVKDEYRMKMEKQLSLETDRITEMYKEILQRLPNITAKLSGSLDGNS